MIDDGERQENRSTMFSSRAVLVAFICQFVRGKVNTRRQLKQMEELLEKMKLRKIEKKLDRK